MDCKVLHRPVVSGSSVLRAKCAHVRQYSPPLHKDQSLVIPPKQHSAHGQVTQHSRGRLACRASGGQEQQEEDKSLFSPEFAQIFQSALSRQNQPAAQEPEEEPKMSALEEVLHSAMADSRRTILQLERQQELLKSMVKREQQQFDRLHFCLRKAKSDTAYLQVLQRNAKQSQQS